MQKQGELPGQGDYLVQGFRPNPYSGTIEVKSLPKAKWKRDPYGVEDGIAQYH
jgi:hypothetical protein